MQLGQAPVQGMVEPGFEPRACALTSTSTSLRNSSYLVDSSFPYLVDSSQNQPPRYIAFPQYISRIKKYHKGFLILICFGCHLSYYVVCFKSYIDLLEL